MTTISPVAVIAHEVRNIASALRTGVSLLEDHLREANHIISIVTENASRLCRIIKRLENGDASPHMHLRPVRLTRTLPSLIAPAFYHPDVRSRRIRILCDFDASNPATVLMDTDFFALALWNVLQNAIQANASSISVRTTADDSHALILIADDGRGIPPDLLPRVFDPFVSGSGSLGLGLTLVQRIIREHGGTIALLPNPTGRGTLVRIALPLTELQPTDEEQ